MLSLYSFLVYLVEKVLPLVALFSPKIKLFVSGRKAVFANLKAKLAPSDKTIWFHAASLGEYEQGLPVIEAVKKQYPSHKIVLTFFSPSGFEVRKNNTVADVTVYLPLDTKKNALQFVSILKPDLVFFIKYEFWPNYLNELKKQCIQTFLISGVFRKNQVFFKRYGGFYRKALETFTYFFVQNESSKNLVQSIGFNNVMLSGDTRFDRVVAILERDNTLDYIATFKDSKTTIVVGSSWPKDEQLLINYINNAATSIKFIIAPHNIKTEQIATLKNLIKRKCVMFSEKENQNLADFDVFIIDTIGLLTKIYSYADVAYVGGGFGHPGVHNLLEPATFGVPIVIGPNYSHFSEAIALVHLKGCISISDSISLNECLDTLIANNDERVEKGHICSTFVQLNKGATNRILNYLLS